MEDTRSPIAKFDLDKAIRLRWALRDIKSARTGFLPIRKDDQQTLIDMGFVKIQEGTPTLTHAGSHEINQADVIRTRP